LYSGHASPNFSIAAWWFAAMFAGRFLPKLGGAFGCRLFFPFGMACQRMMKFPLVCTLALGLAPFAAFAADAPPPCPPGIGIVDRSVGPTVVYLSADPADPESCRMKRGNEVETFFFGTWNTAWPGAEAARRALKGVYAGPPGTSVTFDTSAGPGLQWHDTFRNGGTEELHVLGETFHTMRVVHEREGFDGNTYHSIITQWKDIATGMGIYQNYQHIAGQPEPGTSWDPVSITGGR